MSKARFILAFCLLGSVACAKQNFATEWRLTPVLAPANPEATEFERREIERREEVALLIAERDELGEALLNGHRVFLVGGMGLLDAPAQWKETPARERAEITVALERVVVLSRRKNFLTGRETADDPVLVRAISLLQSLRRFRPQIEPYYGH